MFAQACRKPVQSHSSNTTTHNRLFPILPAFLVGRVLLFFNPEPVLKVWGEKWESTQVIISVTQLVIC